MANLLFIRNEEGKFLIMMKSVFYLKKTPLQKQTQCLASTKVKGDITKCKNTWLKGYFSSNSKADSFCLIAP